MSVDRGLSAGGRMAEEVIRIKGKDIVVREDTARSYRVVMWGLMTGAICLAILTFLVMVLLWRSVIG